MHRPQARVIAALLVSLLALAAVAQTLLLRVPLQPGASSCPPARALGVPAEVTAAPAARAQITVTIEGCSGTVAVSGEGDPTLVLPQGEASAGAAPPGPLVVRVTAPSEPGTTATVTLTDATNVAQTIVVRVPDGVTLPETLDLFDASRAVDPGVLVSAYAKPLAFVGTLPVTVTGPGAPELSVDDGVTWARSVSWPAGRPLIVRGVSSAGFAAAVTFDVAVGTSRALWVVETRARDEEAASLAFSPLFAMPLDTLVGSETRRVTALEDSVMASIAGDGAPEFRLDDGPWVPAGAAPVPLAAGQQVRLRVTTADRFATRRDVRLTVGAKQVTWVVTTQPETLRPEMAFGWAPLTEQDPGRVVESSGTILRGLAAPMPIAVAGDGDALLSIDGGPWVQSGTVQEGSVVALQMRAATGFGVAQTATVAVGEALGSWQVMTRRAKTTVSGDLTFAPVEGAPPATEIASETITVSGFDLPLPVSVRLIGAPPTAPAPRVVIAGGAPAAGGTIEPGQTLSLLATSADAKGETRNVEVRVGSSRGLWTVTTLTDPVDGSGGSFTVPSVNGAELLTLVESAPVTVANLPGPTSVSVSGDGAPRVSIGGGEWVPSGTLAPGQTLRVALTTGSPFATPNVATVTLATGATGRFTVTTRRAVTEVPLAIPPLAGVERGARVTSLPVTLDGFDGQHGLSVTGPGNPEVSVDGGPWGSSAQIRPGAVLTVRQTAAADFNAAQLAELRAGTGQGGWTVTTRLSDEAPFPFGFNGLTQVEPGARVESAPAVVRGFLGALPVSILSPADARVSIGGGAYGTGGTVTAGQTLQLQATAAGAFSTTTNVTVRVGTATGLWRITTRRINQEPSFAFADALELEPGTARRTVTATVTGFDGPLPVALQPGAQGGAVLTLPGGGASGPVTAGSGLTLAMDVPATYCATHRATVRVGTSDRTWSVATRCRDVTPDPMRFEGVGDLVTNLPPFESETITIKGLEDPVPVTLAGGAGAQFRIDGGAWGTAGTIFNNQTLQLRGGTGPSWSGAYDIRVQVGGGAANWPIRTRQRSYDVAGLGFPPVTGALTGVVVESAENMLTGFDETLTLTLGGEGNPEMRLNGGAWTRTAQTIRAGDRLRVRLTASPDRGVGRTADLSAGRTRAGFTVTTSPFDVDPDPFDFADRPNAPRSRVIESLTVVSLTGLESGVAAPVSVTGATAEISINGAAWVTAGTIRNGESLRVRIRTSDAYGEARTATVRVGAVSDPFTATTATVDIDPDPFDFADVTGAARSTLIPGAAGTAAVAIQGFPGQINLEGEAGSYPFQYQVGGGAWTNHTVVTQIASGAQVRLRLTTSADWNRDHVALLRAGSDVVDWRVRTIAQDRDPAPFTFAALSDILPGNRVESTVVTVSGFDGPLMPTVSGSGIQPGSTEYRVNGGGWVTSGVALNPGNTLQLRVRTVTAGGAVGTVGVTLGNYSTNWTVTNLPPGAGSATLNNGGRFSVFVPQGCTQMIVQAWGAGGGGFHTSGWLSLNKNGGGGAFVRATFAVSGGQEYEARVGGGGGGTSDWMVGGGGGGASGLYTVGGTELLVAAGGGAGGNSSSVNTPGGAGGTTTGVNGTVWDSNCNGKGGSQTGGGAGGTGGSVHGAAGGRGLGGNGGGRGLANNGGFNGGGSGATGMNVTSGAGGGGGYFGGGGSCGYDASISSSGAGGGSSFVTATGTSAITQTAGNGRTPGNSAASGTAGYGGLSNSAANTNGADGRLIVEFAGCT